jgi:MFS family permease
METAATPRIAVPAPERDDDPTRISIEELPAGRQRRAPVYALMVGGAVSLVGNELTALAIPWFILQTTGSAARTGLVAFCTLLPMILAMIFGGAVADRFGHRRMSVLSDLLSAATVAAVPVLYHSVGLPFGVLLVLVFVGALLDAPGGTARTALIPDAAALAGMPLERVNSAFQAIQSLAGLVGPLLAGVLIALMGISNVLWLDAATFLVSAAAVAAFVPSPRRSDAPRGRYLDEVREGWRFLTSDPLLRSIAGIATLINFLAAPLFAVLLPVLANEEYGSAADLGVAMASFGAGTLIGAVVYGVVGPTLPRRPVLVGAFAVAAIPLGVLAGAPPLWMTAAALALSGFGIGPINPLVLTVMQERVPAELRARVFGAVGATALVAAPAGVLLAGALAEVLGVQVVIGGIAAGMLLLTIPMLLSPALHELGGDRSPSPVLPPANP